MALRSGYYGVKKSVLRAIEGLSGAKIIKTIGNGLKLTNAGTLSVDVDSETMEFKNGKLSSKGTGIDFSANEKLQGDHYVQTFKVANVVSGQVIGTIPDLDKILAIFGAYRYSFSSQNEWRMLPDLTDVYIYPVIDANTGAISLTASYANRDFDVTLQIYYTKKEV